MKTNLKVKTPGPVTHEGAPAFRLDAERALRRSVMSCLLWEDEFYESGVKIADRITQLVAQTDPEKVMEIAVEARSQMKLRHVPLQLARAMAAAPTHRKLVARTLEQIIQRPDELAEFLALYWKAGRQPLAAQVKKGLAAAFRKFGEYGFAKYDRDGAVRLRDALFLSRAKPADGRRGYGKDARREERKLNVVPTLAPGEVLYRKIADDQLATPDTWEVALSAGADKRATFERLMAEKQLGALATLRNVRNMAEAGVKKTAFSDYLMSIDLGRVLPFRFIAAARAYPGWEDVIEPAMLKCLAGQEKWPGHTGLLIDGSGSMEQKVSAKSDISRRDAACALAILLRELCEEVSIIGFSTVPWEIPPRRGFALRDAIYARVIPESTYLGKAVRFLQNKRHCDRIIVITDEQSADRPPDPQGTGWVINVASHQNGIGYGKWMHLDGFSEHVIEYIRAFESDPRVHGE